MWSLILLLSNCKKKNKNKETKIVNKKNHHGGHETLEILSHFEAW